MSEPKVTTCKETRKLFKKARRVDPTFHVKQSRSGHWEARNQHGRINGSVTPSDRYAAANVKKDLARHLGINVDTRELTEPAGTEQRPPTRTTPPRTPNTRTPTNPTR